MTRRPIESRVSSARTGSDPRDDAMRDAFAAWASGVAVVTARDDDGRLYGMTIAAFTPVSVDPPLVLACIHNDAPLASLIDEGVRCGISILTEGQKRAATTFADRFSVPGDLLSDDEVPVVREAAATLHCTTAEVRDGGDHRIVILRVDEATTADAELHPLLYWSRAYRQLSPEP